MEESKEKVQKVPAKEEQKQVEKLSYEQLEGVAKQMSAQLDFFAKENQQLKNVVQQLRLENMYAQLNFKFKVLEFANFFKPSFVEDIVKDIEEIMTPDESENSEEE